MSTDKEDDSEVHNVVGSRDVGGDIDVKEATEEFEGMQERTNWTGRVWYLNNKETALLWKSGTVLVVGGAKTEEDIDRITSKAADHLDGAGLIDESGED